MRGFFVISASVAMLGVASVASAVFFDDFDLDTSANWAVNKSTGANANNANNIATFAYDYSVMGASSAPGSTGGTTKGLKLESNIAGGILSGLSVSPLGLSVPNDFVMTADVWLSFLGPGNLGGSGSTQLGGMGWGTAGNTAQWSVPNNKDSVFFNTTTDGNSSSDYRAYSSAAPTSYASGNAVYGTTSNNNSNSYYTSAFAATAVLGPGASQTGLTNAGSTGFKWRQWRIEKAGNSLTWKIDGTLLATVDLTTVTLSATKNILINYFDSNATSSTAGADPNRLNAMIVDNILVVPEPATMTALALGVGALLRRRRK